MIDVIIPCADIDTPLLYKSVPMVRENVSDGVNNIYIVGTGMLLDISKDLDCKYVNELEFMGFSKHCINVSNKTRQGWVYQQLIKLSSDKISETDDFLICDADHILLKPHRFIEGGKYNFHMEEEYHTPYFTTMERLLGNDFTKTAEGSFICDKMIFNKDILNELKHDIEIHCGSNWINAILNTYPRREFCGLSEFELYGTYILKKHPEKVNMMSSLRKLLFNEKLGYNMA